MHRKLLGALLALVLFVPGTLNAQGPISSNPVAIFEGTPQNSNQVSAVNTAITTTVPGIAGQSIHLVAVVAQCSAGTATLTITDGITIIFADLAAASHDYRFAAHGFLITSGNAMAVTCSACGIGNTCSLNVIASQY